MTITPDQLVAREVRYCVSSLVATLAQANYCEDDSEALEAMKNQAMELAAPIDDWEDAASEAGWSRNPSGSWSHAEDLGGEDTACKTAEDACRESDIEPHQREVFEHWLVSDWLADKLEAKGEKVDRDFAGMTVWARTTSGQAIAADGVIIAICDELNADA